MQELINTSQLPRQFNDEFELYPFQKEGVNFFTMTNGVSLLGDSPGCGKTIQSIYWCNRFCRKALIIVPASVCYNWKNEIERFTQSKCAIINAKNIKKNLINWQDHKLHYLIISYSYLKFFVRMEEKPWGEGTRKYYFPLNSLNEIKRMGFDTVIMDEAHMTGNVSSQMSKRAMLIGRAMKYKILMTGTPIKNKPQDFFPLLNLLRPDLFPNWKSFVVKYCGYDSKRLKNKFTNQTDLVELHKMIKPFFLQRMKEQVLDQLPDKTRDIMYHDLERHPEYERIVQEIVEAENDFVALRGLNDMRLALGKAMMKNTIDFVKCLLEGSDSKIIVGSMYKMTMEAMQKSKIANQCLYYNGDLNALQKEEVLQRFRTDPSKRVLCGTIKAMGVGLNIQVADKVVVNDPPWTPADAFQFEDRAYRNGQKNNVNVYYMGFKDTYYETMFDIINRKNSISEFVTHGESVTEGNVLQQVIKFLKEKKEKI